MKSVPALLLTGLIAFATESARAEPWGSGCKPACAAECVCFCRPVARQETVTKEYFEVECEYICIPGIKFPWQDCSEPPSCGKVRRVRRLATREYECGTRTVWEWELCCRHRRIECIPERCGSASAPGCCAPMN